MTTTLRATTLHLTGALPGPESPLPAFTPMRALSAIEPGDGVSPEMASRITQGRLATPLPYARHSDYTRASDAVEIPALVLDNGTLTATVLPTLGGRVWSLRDRVRDRELLFVNPQLRPANFGLTDGWFAGGIEWNLGSTGHWTLSSRPLHAARVQTASGDGLRLWEWERTRDLILQVDLELEGDRLLAHTRVINPDPEPKPLYYWTNIAVPETPRTRVLSIADSAWRTDYTGRLAKVPVPHPDSPDVDISYPATASHAADYFFDSPAPGRFVAAVEPDGTGFAQTATDALRGRKLFLWGTGPGGNRWQEWLSGSGARYAEIQAGWCTTQMEHDVIEGHAELSWTESFGGIDLDPEAVSLPFREAAEAARGAVLDGAAPADLSARHAQWSAEVADAAPLEILHVGSGWGHAEVELRRAAGEEPRLPAEALPFPAHPTPQHAPTPQPTPSAEQEVLPGSGTDTAQNPLLDAPAAMPRAAVGAVPGVSDRWQAAYADPSLDAEPWVRYARGVNAHVRGDVDGADAEYAMAEDLAASRGEPVPFQAVRGRALLAAQRGDVHQARALYATAVAAAPQERTLLTEAVAYLLTVGDAAAALTVLDQAPAALSDHGRSRLQRAQALLATGDREGAAGILEGLEVPDLAEGGRELDAIWASVHPGQPLPARLDFRMHSD